MPSVSDVRILLLQARSTEDIELQEQECFMERCRIDPEQLRAVNVLRDALTEDLLSSVDAFMIGGAGEYSAANDYPWTSDLLEFIRFAHETDFPTFGSCWGHQLIARALGGEVIHDSALAEMGCHPVSLTDAGRSDRLFGAFPERFLVNMGHHDRVVTLPPGGVELAVSDTQPNQAFRIDGRRMYGTQFHSELDAFRERQRLYRYREHYPEIASDETFQAVLNNLADTSEVDHLLHDFLRKCVLEPQYG